MSNHEIIRNIEMSKNALENIKNGYEKEEEQKIMKQMEEYFCNDEIFHYYNQFLIKFKKDCIDMLSIHLFGDIFYKNKKVFLKKYYDLSLLLFVFDCHIFKYDEQHMKMHNHILLCSNSDRKKHSSCFFGEFHEYLKIFITQSKIWYFYFDNGQQIDIKNIRRNNRQNEFEIFIISPFAFGYDFRNKNLTKAHRIKINTIKNDDGCYNYHFFPDGSSEFDHNVIVKTFRDNDCFNCDKYIILFLKKGSDIPYNILYVKYLVRDIRCVINKYIREKYEYINIYDLDNTNHLERPINMTYLPHFSQYLFLDINNIDNVYDTAQIFRNEYCEIYKVTNK